MASTYEELLEQKKRQDKILQKEIDKKIPPPNCAVKTMTSNT